MYELVSISCGEATVHYATDSLKELGRKFQLAETSRIRHNGKILTMAEAYALLDLNSKVGEYTACASPSDRPNPPLMTLSASRDCTSTRTPSTSPQRPKIAKAAAVIMPRAVKPKETKKNRCRKVIEQIDKRGNVLARYSSVMEAAEQNFYATSAPVTRACKAGKPTADGRYFRYAEAR